MKTSRIRLWAMGLALLWAGWWVFFALASSLPGGAGQAILATALVALVMFGSVAVAWKWEPVGGTLLVVEGVTVVAAYVSGFLHGQSLETVLVVLSTLALPPVLSGVLFYLSWLRSDALGSH